MKGVDEIMTQADVVIVGAGAVGSAIARELSRYKLDVILIPKKITELGIDRKEFETDIPDMAAAALRDNCIKTNPCNITAKEAETIYRKLL